MYAHFPFNLDNVYLNQNVNTEKLCFIVRLRLSETQKPVE